MIKLKSIFYDQKDLINLIKNNTALIVNCPPEKLSVDISMKNGQLTVEVKKLDKKTFEF